MIRRLCIANCCLLTLSALCSAAANSLDGINKYAIYHFVRQAAYLSRKADALDQKDGTGGSLRRAFSSTVGLADPAGPAVFALVNSLDAQFAALDKQAAQIIAKKNRTSEGLIPPPPPELAALQKKKSALMESLSATLAQQLESDSAGAIAVFLRRSASKAQTSAIQPQGAAPSAP